ncbi:hypothetical protein DFQ26_005277 [Actinomortierella ambigua]|nr:hypothetical protein DFQ26_005277 [Actinomortierella ambigua]
MGQLKQAHAQIRYSCTQLIQELFQRSHVFRECLVEDYPIFLQLTVGIHQHSLPPPAAFAEKTKLLAISLTNEWYKKYGTAYKQLALGYDFLKYHFKVDFTNLVPVTKEAKEEAKRKQEEARQRVLLDKYERMTADIEDKTKDIKENINEMQSCFEILVPRLDNDDALHAIFGAPTENSEESSSDDYHEEHDIDKDDDGEMVGGVYHDPMGVLVNALGSSRYKLTVNVSKDNPIQVIETPENANLFTALRESYRLIIGKQWPLVSRWMDLLEEVDKVALDDSQRERFEHTLNVVAELKESILDARMKSEDLGINIETMYGPRGDQSDDDDEDFEAVNVSEVTKGKSKANPRTPSLQPTKPKQSNPVFAMQGEEILAEDPTYTGGTRVEAIRRPVERSKEPTPEAEAPLEDGEETREQLLARAPVVPWDDDLSYWDKKEVMFNTSGLEFSHRFLGVGDGANMVSQATLDRMKMRTTIYTPQMPKEIKACRHPLKDGGLCPRRDLVKCPFHGVIVPRDEEGNVVSEASGTGQTREEEDEDAKKADAGDIFAIYRQAVSGKFRLASSSKKAALLGAITAAISSPSKTGTTGSGGGGRSHKQSVTWEEIEDEVSEALGAKRKRGKGEPESSSSSSSPANSKTKKKKQSALINLNKLPESAKSRLEKRLGSRATRDQVEQDVREARSLRSRDSGLHQWRG